MYLRELSRRVLVDNTIKDKMDKGENNIASRVQTTFNEAREESLTQGHPILEVEGDSVVRVFPDGNREFVKNIK